MAKKSVVSPRFLVVAALVDRCFEICFLVVFIFQRKHCIQLRCAMQVDTGTVLVAAEFPLMPAVAILR